MRPWAPQEVTPVIPVTAPLGYRPAWELRLLGARKNDDRISTQGHVGEPQ